MAQSKAQGFEADGKGGETQFQCMVGLGKLIAKSAVLKCATSFFHAAPFNGVMNSSKPRVILVRRGSICGIPVLFRLRASWLGKPRSLVTGIGSVTRARGTSGRKMLGQQSARWKWEYVEKVLLASTLRSGVCDPNQRTTSTCLAKRV